MKKHTVCVIPGDGIGPDVIAESLRLLDVLSLPITYTHADAGFKTYQTTGSSLPQETIDLASKANAILFGAVTTPPNINGYISPIVALRKKLQLYANVRPFEPLPNIETEKKLNIILVRENTEDLYTGKEDETEEGVTAYRVITQKASERIIRFAFALAIKQERKKVTIIHKANVLRKSDGLFLKIGNAIASEFPTTECTDMLVDSCAMQLIKNPQQFDVLVTTNMFGDILSDEIAGLSGGLGIAPSANIGDTQGLFEPVHGSAPKYAGKNVANPLAAFLSVSLMLDFLHEHVASVLIKQAIYKTLESRIKTHDIGGQATMSEFTNIVINHLKGLI